MNSIMKMEMGVVFGPKLSQEIANKKKKMKRCFLEDIGIFYEINKEKNKGEKFSNILNNIIIFQVKKVTFQ